ncbi:efflux pump antibiotic resistance [Lecanosticta acicola]|uniref:Efflux pump antibiotic resistance n=1 Tax=Lecanosticta acicola TaxID=111012 RepID=A0AAI8YS23_9PEZI|nr:efflux pump antibiotic resistance [Lecanosticta acicola]
MHSVTESKRTSKAAMTSFVSVDSLDKEDVESTMPHDERVPEWTPSRQVKLIVLGQAFVVFAISLDMTILTTTLPDVAQALNADAIMTFWIAASYLLANAVIQPIVAAVADIFGRRSVIFVALVLFTLGSILCAVADNVAWMLAGRTIQGIGGGGILSVNLIIVSDLVPLRYRAKYISFQQLCVSVGFNVAPIIGGLLVKHTTWRWLFYINLPFCAIGLTIIPFALRYERPKSSIDDKLSNVDWAGSLMFISGMTTFLVGITWGGTQFPWNSAATLVPLILGLAVVFITGLYERFLAKVTFLRLSLFHSWSAIAIYACTVLQGLTLFSELYFLVLYLLTVRLYSPLHSGIFILAFSMICVPVSGTVGPVIVRVGSYRWAVWSGWVINTLALGILTMLDAKTPTVAWVFMFLTAGIGQGLLFIAHSIAAQAACRQKDAAHAMAMYSFTRSLGLCLGVALGGTIFQNFMLHQLAHQGLPIAIAKVSEGFAPFLQAMPASAERAAIIDAYAWSLQMLFTTLCGISGLGLFLSCFIRGHSLNQEHEAEHRLRDDGPAITA